VEGGRESGKVRKQRGGGGGPPRGGKKGNRIGKKKVRTKGKPFCLVHSENKDKPDHDTEGPREQENRGVNTKEIKKGVRGEKGVIDQTR